MTKLVSTLIFLSLSSLSQAQSSRINENNLKLSHYRNMDVAYELWGDAIKTAVPTAHGFDVHLEKANAEAIMRAVEYNLPLNSNQVSRFRKDSLLNKDSGNVEDVFLVPLPMHKKTVELIYVKALLLSLHNRNNLHFEIALSPRQRAQYLKNLTLQQHHLQKMIGV